MRGFMAKGAFPPELCYHFALMEGHMVEQLGAKPAAVLLPVVIGRT